MKVVRDCVISLCVLTAGASAHAGAIFDNITGIPADIAGNASVRNSVTIEPLGASFGVGVASTLTSVTLSLRAATQGGGFTLVYLVPDGPGHIPTSSGRVLTGATLLGTILDSALATTEALPTLTINQSVAAGTYWIELVNSSDTGNGGSGVNSSASWYFNVDGRAGVGVAGQYSSNYYTPSNSFTSFPDADSTAFRMIVQATPSAVTVPEPASLALLGVGIAGMGLVLRRRQPRD